MFHVKHSPHLPASSGVFHVEHVPDGRAAIAQVLRMKQSGAPPTAVSRETDFSVPATGSYQVFEVARVRPFARTSLHGTAAGAGMFHVKQFLALTRAFAKVPRDNPATLPAAGCLASIEVAAGSWSATDSRIRPHSRVTEVHVKYAPLPLDVVESVGGEEFA